MTHASQTHVNEDALHTPPREQSHSVAHGPPPCGYPGASSCAFASTNNNGVDTSASRGAIFKLALCSVFQCDYLLLLMRNGIFSISKAVAGALSCLSLNSVADMPVTVSTASASRHRLLKIFSDSSYERELQVEALAAP